MTACLSWAVCVRSRRVEVRPGLGRVAERARREQRQLAGVAVGERDRDAAGARFVEAGDGVGREARACAARRR